MKQEIIDIKKQASKFLSEIIPQEILEIHQVFKANGFKLYLVGGAVRDAILNQQPKDNDLATDALPEQIIAMFKDKYRLNLQGQAFGVVVIYTEQNSEGFEIATFRQDISIGRHPDVKVGVTIDKDVLRRDLTINALFYDIDTKEIVDLVNGVEDLINGVINAVGDPVERFVEDRLRIMRAARFASRYGNLSLETHKAIVNMQYPLLEGISKERIYDEFTKGLKQAKNPKNYMDLLFDLGILDEMFPEFKLNIRFIEDSNVVTILAILLKNTSIESVKKLTSELCFPLDITHKIIAIKRFMESNDIIKDVFYLHNELKKYNVSIVELWKTVLHIGTAEQIKFADKIFMYTPTISGDDLIAEGFVGKEIGVEKAKRESAQFLSIL